MIKYILFLIILVLSFSTYAQNNILSNQITVTFSEPMDSTGFRNSDIWTITRTSDNANISIIGVGVDTTKQPMQGFTEFILVVYPNTLQFGEEYRIEVQQGSVTDLAGNPIADKNNVWLFVPYRSSSLPVPRVTFGAEQIPTGYYSLVNSGGASVYVDLQNREWQADYGFTNGITVNRGFIPIANTEDDVIYRTERYAMDGYNVPVPSGSYIVKIHYAETYAGITRAGQRVFDMNVEGQFIEGIDPFAEAGGRQIAVIRTINNVLVQDGVINITFALQAPVINGIEILGVQ
jgi:hypothetical protein